MKKLFALVVLPAFLMSGLAFAQQANALNEKSPWGRFEGQVVAVWDPNGRTMTLQEPFAYIEPEGGRWEAPQSSVVDGASIPQWAWSLIGGPFEGLYRDASVIHDVACVKKTRPWESVHRAFYTAMRARGVGEIRAKIMYAAVYHFGPRWALPITISSLSDEGVNSILKAAKEAGSGVEVTVHPAKDSKYYNAKVIGSVNSLQKSAYNDKAVVALIGKIQERQNLSADVSTITPDTKRSTINMRFSAPRTLDDKIQFEALREQIEANNISLDTIDKYKPSEMKPN